MYCNTVDSLNKRLKKSFLTIARHLFSITLLGTYEMSTPAKLITCFRFIFGLSGYICSINEHFKYIYSLSVPITTEVLSSNPVFWRGVLDTTLCDKVCQ